jgi:uncharacterized protein YjiS (DUF1127 family)
MTTIVVAGKVRHFALERKPLRLLDLFLAAESWLDRRAQRADLAELDDHMLHDVGLSRADVEREVAKPFWRA